MPDDEAPHMQTLTRGGVSRYLLSLMEWLQQPNLFAMVYVRAPEQHISREQQLRARQQREKELSSQKQKKRTAKKS